MGSVNNPQQHDLFNWIQIQSHRYLNQNTKQLIDHSQVNLFNEDDVKLYGDRLKIVKENIVQLYYFRRVVDCESGCSHNYYKLDVFVEGGLSNITNLLQNNKLYKYNKKCYCNEIVRGFQFLKQIYGSFEVSLPMIWLDSNNKIKLWINENLFLNSLRLTKESVMILQIKQILIKLECKCNIAFEEQLSFSTLRGKKKTHDFFFFPNQIKYNLTTPELTKCKDASFDRHNIFYYPTTPTTVKIQKVTQNISYQNRSNVQIVQAQNYCHALIKVENPPHENRKVVENSKNYSTISIPSKVNIKYSTPKLSNNEHQSTKVTPIKMESSSRHVEMVSTEQNSNWKDSFKNDRSIITGFKQKPGKISQNKSDINIFMSKKKSSKKNITYKNGNSKNLSIESSKNGSKEQKIIPFTLHSKQQLKDLSLSRTKLKNILKEKKFKEKASQKEEGEKGKKGVYQNSFTERQIMQPPKNLYSKPRNSVQVEKLDTQYEQKIQYEVPEKMKRIIQKYLLDKEDSKSSIKSSQNSTYQYQNPSKGNKMPSNRNKSIVDKYPRLSIQEEDEFAKTDHENSDSVSLIRIENQELEQNLNQSKSKSKQRNIKNALSESIIKQYKKKTSEKLYTQIQDEQQTKIRKKVAQKKAIFADLKAQASKILQSRVEIGF